MEYYYYINSDNQKDGPHDLVTVMRRIRSGIIVPDTLVSMGEREFAQAYSIEQLSSFFNNPVEDMRHELTAEKKISINRTISKGWHFTMDHQGMAVFAGAILLVSWLFGVLILELLHMNGSGIIGSWIMFVFLQSCFFAVSLRIYRGQKTDLNFLENTLAPVLGKIAFLAVIFSFLIIFTLPFLIIPGVISMLLITYIPMFILDYDAGIGQTIKSIFSMMKKLDSNSLLKLFMLTFFYLICIALIIPIPVILPIIAGSFCSIYEDLATS